MDLFEIRGEDSDTDLFTSNSSAECERWANQYVRFGDFGGWAFLTLFENANPENPADQGEVIGILEPGAQWAWI